MERTTGFEPATPIWQGSLGPYSPPAEIRGKVLSPGGLASRSLASIRNLARSPAGRMRDGNPSFLSSRPRVADSKDARFVESCEAWYQVRPYRPTPRSTRRRSTSTRRNFSFSRASSSESGGFGTFHAADSSATRCSRDGDALLCFAGLRVADRAGLVAGRHYRGSRRRGPFEEGRPSPGVMCRRSSGWGGQISQI